MGDGLTRKVDGPIREVKAAQVVLLEALSAQSMVNVSRWPAMKVGTGMEWIGIAMPSDLIARLESVPLGGMLGARLNWDSGTFPQLGSHRDEGIK